jgi:molecular chaperone GrpE
MDKPHSPDDETIALEAADVASLVAENAALRDRYLRALADAENARRRSEQQAADARAYAVTQFARELLPVADNLRRAIESVETQAALGAGDAALLEGIKATERMLAAAFERFGVRRIAAEGAAFDPAFHEAVMELDNPEAPSGTVLQVLEDGYTIHDRLLRAARVVVAKRRRAQPPPES